jgi:hypothetical protein
LFVSKNTYAHILTSLISLSLNPHSFQVRIATHLASNVLAPFVNGDREGFHAWMAREADLLAEGAFGPQMLLEVGLGR